MSSPRSPQSQITPQSPRTPLSPKIEVASFMASFLNRFPDVPKKRQSKKEICPCGRIRAQCRLCCGKNICPEHGNRKTRCLDCWYEGRFPSELCPVHGRRIGACSECIRRGVQKQFKHTPCIHGPRAYKCPHCKVDNLELYKNARKGKRRVAEPQTPQAQ
jgi:hypothetical protein